jgi:hypothetical protein
LRFGSFFEEQSLGVAIEASGGVIYSANNIVITGRFAGTVDFGGGNLTPVGQTDLFLAKYTSTGGFWWAKRFGSALDDIGCDVSINTSGYVNVTGSYQSTINFGGNNLPSSGSRDVFVAQFNYLGTHNWSKHFGGSGSDEGLGIGVQNYTFVTGYFTGLASFGGNLFDAGATNAAFLAAYDVNGLHKWSYAFGNANGETKGLRVVADKNNNILFGGFMAPGAINFGGGDLYGQGANDIFVARFSGAGVHQWSMSAGTPHYQEAHGVALDASNHALATGYFVKNVDLGKGDLLASGSSEAFVAKFAYGVDEPLITSISDIGNDQGRRVKVVFQRSVQDEDSAELPVTKYESYRRIDSPPQVQARSAAAVMTPGWTQVGEVSAHGESEYSIDVPTIGDSTLALGQYYSVFKIRAATEEPTAFYDSEPDSGYSVDNLAPGVPGSLLFAAGQLSWKDSSADDFDFFSIYGASTSSFLSATLIGYAVAPALNVSESPYAYYFVTATDFSGNEGKPASVHASTGVGGTPKSYVLSVSAYPNPFNPLTTIRYTLPARGRVVVDIYDASGRRVTGLIDEEKPAGAFAAEWRGNDASGNRVASGVYFARLSHGGETKSYKIVMLK